MLGTAGLFTLFRFHGTIGIFDRLLHVKENRPAVSVKVACDLIAQLWVAGIRHNCPHGIDEILVAGTERIALLPLRFGKRNAFHLVALTNTNT